jgi:hypothetical protein
LQTRLNASAGFKPTASVYFFEFNHDSEGLIMLKPSRERCDSRFTGEARKSINPLFDEPLLILLGFRPTGLNSLLSAGFSLFGADTAPPVLGDFAICFRVALRQILRAKSFGERIALQLNRLQVMPRGIQRKFGSANTQLSTALRNQLVKSGREHRRN